MWQPHTNRSSRLSRVLAWVLVGLLLLQSVIQPVVPVATAATTQSISAGHSALQVNTAPPSPVPSTAPPSPNVSPGNTPGSPLLTTAPCPAGTTSLNYITGAVQEFLNHGLRLLFACRIGPISPIVGGNAFSPSYTIQTQPFSSLSYTCHPDPSNNNHARVTVGATQTDHWCEFNGYVISGYNPAAGSSFTVQGWVEPVSSSNVTSYVPLWVLGSTQGQSGTPLSAFPDDKSRTQECNQVSNGMANTGHPVNTRTGNYWTQVSDLAVQTVGPALSWSRTYVSQAATSIDSALGLGWQHPYAARLTTPSMTGGEAGKVLILTPGGNLLRYTIQGSAYSPEVGVHSTLALVGSEYIQTLRDQTQYAFSSTTGRLTRIVDPVGQQLLLDYDTGFTPVRLTKVRDGVDSTRALTLGYNTNGRIASVSDGTRTVAYTYLSNDLRTVQDVMGRTATYTYTNHLLTDYSIAPNQPIEHIVYEASTPPRVQSQTLIDGRQIQFTYNTNATILTTTRPDGPADVDEYGYTSDNKLQYISHNNEGVLGTSFTGACDPALIRDGVGNPTQTSFTSLGLPLQITNAVGEVTRLLYDGQNRPISTTDALGITSQWAYDSHGNLTRETRGITTTSALRATTTYTYSYDTTYYPGGRLDKLRAPDGVVTRFVYDTTPTLRRRVLQQVVGDGLPAALQQTTTYGYDALGRVELVTRGAGTSLARADKTVYNADNTIARTIQNFQGAGSYSAAFPDRNIVTSYGYDRLGRTIAVTDTLGRVSTTGYNLKGQVAWTAQNAVPLQFAQGQPVKPAFNPAAPDANVVTEYSYDGLGRQTQMVQTGILTGTFTTTTRTFNQAITRTTRTQYDAQGRPQIVMQNYQDGVFDPARPDEDVQSISYYDGAGNVIWQRDGWGRWTKTDYDALNRPVLITQNYEDGQPTVGMPDADIQQRLRYDRGGRTVEQVLNAVTGVYQASQPSADHVHAVCSTTRSGSWCKPRPTMPPRTIRRSTASAKRNTTRSRRACKPNATRWGAGRTSNTMSWGGRLPLHRTARWAAPKLQRAAERSIATCPTAMCARAPPTMCSTAPPSSPTR